MPIRTELPVSERLSELDYLSSSSDSDFNSCSSSDSSETDSPTFSTAITLVERQPVCTSELVRRCLETTTLMDKRRPVVSERQLIQRSLQPPLSGSEAQLAVSAATWRLLTEQQRSRMTSRHISRWLGEADYEIRSMGWQQESILSVPHLVMLHGLLRRIISPHPESLNRVEDVRSLVLVSFYIICSYAGQEISYPYRPFATTTDRVFWSRCIPTACAVSGELLRLTTDRRYYDCEQQRLRQAGMEAIYFHTANQKLNSTRSFPATWNKVKHFVSRPAAQVA